MERARCNTELYSLINNPSNFLGSLHIGRGEVRSTEPLCSIGTHPIISPEGATDTLSRQAVKTYLNCLAAFFVMQPRHGEITSKLGH